MRSVLIGFEYPCGTLRIILLRILYGDPRPGVADGYSLSRSHCNLRSWNFPAVRDKVGSALVKLTDYTPKNKRIYQAGERCSLVFDPELVYIL